MDEEMHQEYFDDCQQELAEEKETEISNEA